ncbi:MAG: tau 95 subunit of transcription factor TFIIIC [Stictis urceolatum]|nr:tau 95 subunit of transcription factor TFIIIC [Stictis urceolata]
MAMAPSYLSERCRLTSVEHPFIVRNADKVADTLGGSSEVAKLVNPKTAKKGASLYLRRDDPMTVPITSANVATDNLLLEISVPKLTGRKRKRGSDGPFQEYPSEQNETSPDEGPRNLLKRLSKSSDQVDIRTIGPIAHTHRFRSMPDFAYSTSKQKYMEQIHRTLLPLNCKPPSDPITTRS